MDFDVATDDRLTTVDVTDRVAETLPADCVEGVCTVFVRHTTAALVVQENEPRLRGDLESFLSGLVPDEGHAHDELDGNADAHLRATLLGPSATVPIEDGALALGRWQSIFLVECDGPRTRQVSVTVTS
ncbi:secondary thiamine-phosphate synthase enzyme YjbQ [Halobacteria archaeon AArc-m2/3/4]|uniref:Secondary thiamine-phosphate synthase enzyme YjbQ n=1 Tax=Natronoglomus mannanivorans TaxID=2979990 RepID=A0ABT2Q9I6_9EURY|nr:secondary thiamine-phosphate synthase enzyme YjbQ [Halobacteria archaeon AArc-m2/3/4]